MGPGDGDIGIIDGADVGAACEENSDCAGEGAVCLDELEILPPFFSIEFPGGACAIPGCESDEDCPEGSACLEGFSEPACTALCDDDSDCREDEGYTCGVVPMSGDEREFCQPPFELPGFLSGITELPNTGDIGGPSDSLQDLIPGLDPALVCPLLCPNIIDMGICIARGDFFNLPQGCDGLTTLLEGALAGPQ
jgi:hypothetical protein